MFHRRFKIIVVITLLLISSITFLEVPIPIVQYAKAQGTNTYNITLNLMSIYQLNNSNTNWNTCRTNSTADYIKTPTGLTITYLGTKNDSGEYTIYRTALVFDTEILPPDANINFAEIALYGYQENIGTDFEIHVQNGSGDAHPATLGSKSEYNYSLYGNNGGSLNTTAVNQDTWSNITLNSVGRSWINNSGKTRFMLRAYELDIADCYGEGKALSTVGFYVTNYPIKLVVNFSTNYTFLKQDVSTNTDYFYKTGSHWDVLHDASSATYVKDYAYERIGWMANSSLYRTSVVVDTSSIPSNASIVEAHLVLNKQGDFQNDSRNPGVILQYANNTVPHANLQASDFDYTFYNWSGIGGQLWQNDTDNWAPYTGYSGHMRLNSNGLTWLNKTGETRWILRWYDDYINRNQTIAYGNAVDNYCTINDQNAGYVEYSYLAIVYTTNSPPTFYNPSPTNQTTGVSLQPTCSIQVNDSDGDTLTVNFWNSTDGNSWTHQQCNASVLANSTVTWLYSEANAENTTYYWKVSADDGSNNETIVYLFTTTDTNPPSVVINLAGNQKHNFTSYSYQTGSTLYINCSITDNSTVNNTVIHLYNVDTGSWDNSTWSLTHTTGDYYETTITGLNADTNYSFDIYADDDYGNCDNTTWYRINEAGNNVRKQVRFNCTPIDINYTIFYYNDAPFYSVAAKNKRRLAREQWTNNGQYDVGMFGTTVRPTGSAWGHTQCSFEGHYLNKSVCINPFTINNFHIHIWTSSDTDDDGVIGWFNQSYYLDGSYNDGRLSNSSTMVTNFTRTLHGFSNYDWRLFAHTIYPSSPPTFTSTNIYDFCIKTYDIGISIFDSNLSGFIIFNIPNNSTLQTYDNDNDGLSDYTELWVTFTDPFYADTDDDGESDLRDSTPNDYADTTQCPALPTGISVTNNSNQVNITFTHGTGGSHTMVRRNASGSASYPTSITDGVLVANTTNSYALDTGLEGGCTYYYSLFEYDNGANLWSNGFNFTTGQPLSWSNTAPSFSGENPSNNSVDVNLQPTINVTITDVDGNASTCDFYISTDGNSWTHVQNNGSVLNQSISYHYVNANSYSTTYYWKVSANDGNDNVSVVYRFTTKANTAPTLSIPYPSNGSKDMSIQPICHITVVDADGDNMDVTWYENTTGGWVLRQTNSSVNNGTYYWVYQQASSENTTYYWKVNVNDGTNTTTSIYLFTTYNSSNLWAHFGFTPQSQVPNKNVTFIDMSIANGTTIMNWTWDFGDGTTSYDQNPSHRFPHNGVFCVSLTITDNKSNTAKAYGNVTIKSSDSGTGGGGTGGGTQPKYSITIEVKDENGNPLPNAEVHVGNNVKRTDNYGKAKFLLKPDNYIVTVVHDGHIVSRKNITVDNIDTFSIIMYDFDKDNIITGFVTSPVGMFLVFLFLGGIIIYIIYLGRKGVIV